MSDTVDWGPLEDEASREALELIRTRFEGGVFPGHMHYHNRLHTRGVIEKARQIGEALAMSDRELLLTTIAAAFHDTVQNWVPSTKEDGTVIRLRFAGSNEIASAKEAMDWIDAHDAPLAPEEKGLIATAILATIPVWTLDYNTVIQPFLTPDSHKVVRAVALADLASSGTDPDLFLSDAPNLFAEENLDVMETLDRAQSVGDIEAAAQDEFRTRYLGWLGIQPDFARGRQRYFADVESANLDPQSRMRLEALFSSYDASIIAAEQALDEARALGFAPLMRQLTPGAFPRDA